MAWLEKGNGDLMISWNWVREDPGDRFYPGEPAHPEDIMVFFRGRPIERISNKKMRQIEEEIVAFEADRWGGHRDGDY